MLSHVNVYKKGESTKMYTLYCDHKPGGKSQHDGRFSMVEYTHLTNGNDHIGMIVALFSYAVMKDSQEIEYFNAAVVAQITPTSNQSKSECNVFPRPSYKWNKERDHSFTLHQIMLSNIKKPVFFVSHGVLNESMNSNKINTSNRFFVLTQGEVHCEHILRYQQYVDNNRLIGYSNKQQSVLDLPIFMSVENILRLKEDLHVYSKCIKKGKSVENEENVDDEVHCSSVLDSIDSESDGGSSY